MMTYRELEQLDELFGDWYHELGEVKEDEEDQASTSALDAEDKEMTSAFDAEDKESKSAFGAPDVPDAPSILFVRVQNSLKSYPFTLYKNHNTFCLDIKTKPAAILKTPVAMILCYGDNDNELQDGDMVAPDYIGKTIYAKCGQYIWRGYGEQREMKLN